MTYATVTEFVGPEGYVHGWKFVGVPGVTPHSDLLRMRKEARASLPQSHPERLKAERAVRQSRKLPTASQKASISEYHKKADEAQRRLKASVARRSTPEELSKDVKEGRRTREEVADELKRRGEKPKDALDSQLLAATRFEDSSGRVLRQQPTDPSALGELRNLAPHEKEYLARTHEIHVVKGRNIRAAISQHGINAAIPDYGSPIGLHHENKILISQTHLNTGAALHEAGHAMDEYYGRASVRYGGPSSFFRLTAKIRRELGNEIEQHYQSRKAGGGGVSSNADKEIWAELFSQYRSGIRNYDLGGDLTVGLNSEITKYFESVLTKPRGA